MNARMAQLSFARAFSQMGADVPTPDKTLHNAHVQVYNDKVHGWALCEYCGEPAYFDGMCPTCIGDIYGN